MRVHLDERSAAFFALGVGRASDRPAVVLTTSGTAAANVFPAVVEAAQAQVPLIVLTADRPHRLRGADANQAIDQIDLYGGYARAFHEVGPPSGDPRDLRHLRTLAGRAVADAIGQPAGPVHLNFPFDKPLEPAPPDEPQPSGTGQARRGGGPYVRVSRAVPRASDGEIRELAEILRSGSRGLIVAGPSAGVGADARAVVGLAAATGYPLLADPLSGARWGPAGGAIVVPAYDLFLRDPEVRDLLRPDLVIRIGASPTSAALQKFLFHHAGVRHLVVDAAGRWKGHAAIETDYLRADAADTCVRLAELVDRSAGETWSSLWRDAGASALETLAAVDPGLEAGAARQIFATLPPSSRVFVSNSMPIRDVDGFAAPEEKPLTVFANRGASGIDGIVSSAFGVASAGTGPVVCLTGDLAFFHDQNGLLWSREGAPVVFVLVDNDGGGIFHMLPVSEHEPYFTRLFAAPHGLDFAHVARLHGIAFQDVSSETLVGALETARLSGETTILRIRTERAGEQRARAAAAAAVARAVRIHLTNPDDDPS